MVSVSTALAPALVGQLAQWHTLPEQKALYLDK